MSKDIWHITNQDENTTDVPEKESFVVLIGHWTSCLWYGGETPEPIFWENVKKWCYLDDLLALETKLDRTRKALAFAKSKLNGIHRLYSKAFYKRDDWLQVCMEMVDKANTALDKITALEQKD